MRISDWSSDVCSSDLSPSAWTTTLVEYGEPIGGIGANFGCGLHGDRCCFGASRQHRQLVIEACQLQPDHNAVLTPPHEEFARFRRQPLADELIFRVGEGEPVNIFPRPEERSVGTKWVCEGRSRWVP